MARTVLPITATIDHRYADGWHVSRAMAAERCEPQLPAQAPATA